MFKRIIASVVAIMMISACSSAPGVSPAGSGLIPNAQANKTTDAVTPPTIVHITANNNGGDGWGNVVPGAPIARCTLARVRSMIVGGGCATGTIGEPSCVQNSSCTTGSKYRCDADTGWGCNVSAVCQSLYAQDVENGGSVATAFWIEGGSALTLVAAFLATGPGGAWAEATFGASATQLTTASFISALLTFITGQATDMTPNQAFGILAAQNARSTTELQNGCQHLSSGNGVDAKRS